MLRRRLRTRRTSLRARSATRWILPPLMDDTGDLESTEFKDDADRESSRMRDHRRLMEQGSRYFDQGSASLFTIGHPH